MTIFRFLFVVACFTCAQCCHADAPAAASKTAFLASHCLDCHQGNEPEAGLDLQQLSTDLNTPATFDRWVTVFDRIRAGEMPPRDAEQPPESETSAFLDTTGTWLKQHQQQEYQQLGRVRARRLTNLQLERTLQDLLGVDIPLASLMPDEPKTDGFTTVAAGQSISHFQLQTHLAVVDTALDEAFRRALSKPDEWTRSYEAREVARKNPKRRTREPEMLDGRAVVWSSKLTFYGRLPVTTAREDGWYRLKVRASALNVPDDHGVWCTVRTGMCVSSAPLLAWAGAFEAGPEPREWTFEAWLPRGHMFEVRPGDDTLKMGRFAGGQVGAGEGTPQNLCGVAIEGIELERFHRGPDDQQIRQWLFGDLRLKPAERGQDAELVSESPRRDATELLSRFAGRAFRRPVASEELQPYAHMVHQELDQGVPLLQALQGGYRAILCSPRFLHFYEEPGELDDYALASRLSYLMWNTMPDQELLSRADRQQLRDDGELKRQVERMLSDPRGAHLVKDFAHQWLDLSEIDFTEPDRKLYPGFDVIVEESMLQETHAFLQEMIDRDLSVRHLIDADFTWLNSRLARYYGIDRVTGDQLQKVELRPEDNYGGLVTQGAIMKITANGTNTSPVIRGVWLSERLLGVDIPPPPENVPAIEPDIRGARTIREMLAKHKSAAECASCHVKIDPPGFALENFDPSGRWRDRYLTVVKGRRSRGPEVDPSFDMPDGQHFQSLQEFQKLVLEDDQALAANVVRHLIAYGTGASCGFADRDAVDQIVRQSEESGYGLRSLLTGVVTSQLFRTK
ncbi:MAG: DUF1592 domain-containing protein [Fuerstiella sp.]